MATTFEKLRDIVVAKYHVDASTITPDSTMESLGLDSLDLIELLFEVEDGFNIRVPQDGGSAIRTATMGELVETIDKIVAEGGAQPAEGAQSAGAQSTGAQ